MFEKQKIYTVLLTEEGFPIIHQCPTCWRPVRFAPYSFQDPGEACQEFKEAIKKITPVCTYVYVTPLEYLFILGIDLLLGDI